MHHPFIICGGISDVTGTGNEREIISRDFPPRISTIFSRRAFSGASLDSMYGQWNCESNLYRVTIALLPPMLNHFPPLELCSHP